VEGWVCHNYKAGAVVWWHVNWRVHEVLPGLLSCVCIRDLLIAHVVCGHLDLHSPLHLSLKTKLATSEPWVGWLSYVRLYSRLWAKPLLHMYIDALRAILDYLQADF